MSNPPATGPSPEQGRQQRGRNVAGGLAAIALGGAAVVVPLVVAGDAAFLVGLLVAACGALQLAQAFSLDERTRTSGFYGGGLSVAAGLLLLARPVLAATALAVLLGGAFLIDGAVKLVAAWNIRGRPDATGLLAGGLVNAALGVLIAVQWPLDGPRALGVYLGIRMVAAGWAMLFVRTSPAAMAPEVIGHPDYRLGLAPHPELARLVTTVNAEEQVRRPIDRYWWFTFLITFFAIHVGRMDAEWSLVGFISPLVAVLGDVAFAFLLALGIVTPIHLAWRRLTRPLERRAWARLVARADTGGRPGIVPRLVRWWLLTRVRFAVRVNRAYWSPRAALRRGLHVGLPLTAVLVATNPIWGFSWYFNTENWAAGFWEKWVEYRVDPWRQQMVQAVRDRYAGGPLAGDALFQVRPEGVAGATDFRFLVIGDPGEGDASQHALRDQYLALGSHPDVKFLLIASDVVYPGGAMKDYEFNFYLPFKGITRPIYAVPGNHDWYNSLEGFNANFLEPDAARAAMRARVAADKGLTSTTERRIDELIDEAARLRRAYGLRTGGQRTPYFEMHGDRFALIVVDTGILKTVDDDQLHWLGEALGRARGKFRMVILGHPLYAGGHHQAGGEGVFADIHRLLREHAVEVVMGGDTHDFEYYRESYESEGRPRATHHFVNGGGGAYLSIGTAMGWPEQPAVPDTAIYPSADAVIAKLDAQTPGWKRPLWFWLKRLGAWPSSPEALAGVFDFNRAPFFQSFVEVRVEGSADAVRLIPHGVSGPLRWRDLQLTGQVRPSGKGEDDPVEFTVPLPRAARAPAG